MLLFVSSYVLIVCTVPLPPGVNPIAVDKYIYLSIYIYLIKGAFVGKRNSDVTYLKYYDSVRVHSVLTYLYYGRKTLL